MSGDTLAQRPSAFVTRASRARAGGDSCTLSLDGGAVCPDMGGAVAMPDPGDVAVCVAESATWNDAYWNAFFACYLDGRTSNCESDFDTCQESAYKKVGSSKAAMAFSAACGASSCATFNPDVCFASFEIDDAALDKGTACFSLSCDQIAGCLTTAGVD